MSEKIKTPHYEYPYPSDMAERAKKDEWQTFIEPGFSLQGELDRTEGPILEIAGPSDLGYIQLDGVKLKRRVIISNLTKDSLKYGPDPEQLEEQTELLIDGTDTQLPDNETGMVLTSYLPVANKVSEDNSEELEWARTAPARALERGYVSDEDLQESPRLKIASEVYRILKPGGIYITDGPKEDVAAFELLGFQLKASVEKPRAIHNKYYYYVTLQKPTETD